jgi:uncharacterized alpha-E superfamily protein
MLRQRLSVDDIAARRPPVTSRTAENLFWLGRYTERTEQQVRLARATLNLIDTDDDAPPSLRAALSELAVRTGLAPWGVPTLNQSAALFERALRAALADPGAGSVAFNLGALERAASALRERLSTEQWGLVRAMADGLRPLRAPPPDGVPTAAQVLAALDRLAVQLAALTGAQSDRMTRDHGWRFLTAGRLAERLIGLAGTIAAFEAPGALGSAPGMALLLELFDSTITFRARWQRHEDLLALIDLLVLDGTNPRALAGVLRRLRTELRKLPGGDAQTDVLLALLPAAGAGIELQALRGLDDALLQRLLGDRAERLMGSGLELADVLGHQYFAHAAGGDGLQRV